jgi:hypothetical protein
VLLEKKHPQIGLRSHIFNNILNIFVGSNESEENDRKAAERARIRIQSLVPKLYRDFHDLVSSVQPTMKCDRAKERPVFKRRAFDTNIPRCKRGVNKTCVVERFIRESIIPRLEEITTAAEEADSDQLVKTCGLCQKVNTMPDIDLSSSDCRSAGDCLIIFSAEKLATHTLSTNAREWAPLSKLIGAEFSHVTYPGEE